MSYNKDYSKFSQKKEDVDLEEIINHDNIINENETSNQIHSEDLNNEVIENSQNEENIVSCTVGFVDNCECLRVRKEPNVDSEELCIINKLSEVVIDLDNSTEYFYKVKTSDDIEGYCMKKFITIK